jgi:hypothetical protein
MRTRPNIVLVHGAWADGSCRKESSGTRRPTATRSFPLTALADAERTWVLVTDLPVFVANGDSDPMILPRYS